MGCATFTPLKVVARRERAARALGAAARGARTATGATMAAMITAVLLDVISTPSLSELFPRRDFLSSAQPLPKNKIRDCSPIRSRQSTPAVRRESEPRWFANRRICPLVWPAVTQPERGKDRPASAGSVLVWFRNRDSPPIRSVRIDRAGRSVASARGRFCQTPDAHLSRGSWCVCAARAVARVGSDGRARVR